MSTPEQPSDLEQLIENAAASAYQAGREAAGISKEDLAAAVADEIERRQHKPTLQETMREKTRQLLRQAAERDARHLRRG